MNSVVDDAVIKVNNVSKVFKLPHERSNSIKSAFVHFWKKDKGYEKLVAIKDISFEVKKGEFFGIVGRNGGGKSTLLKMLSGIYSPTKGQIQVNGKLTPFIELGVGFNPELTGRENVFLNGSLLGFNRKEMAAMYKDIVEFAELERFMDQKLKNYSSGMQVRLAFSIAIKVNTDILVLDEVLAVGDEAFQQKCSDFFDKIKKDKTKTVILVTHSMDSVKKYCTNAMLISEGKIVKSGDPEDVANAYSEENLEVQNSKTTKYPSKIKTVAISKGMLTNKEEFTFKIDYDYTGTSSKLYLAYTLLDIRRGGITYDPGIFLVKSRKDNMFKIPLKLFNDGEFRVTASLRVGDKDNLVAFTDENSSCTFSIRNKDDNDNYALLKSLK